MQVIDLGGRTAVPGLVDNHNHFVLLGLRPGHDTRLETAASIADVQAAIRARQNREPWRLDHGHGRLDPRPVHRKPPADACGTGSADPSNPVLLFVTFIGPAVTNTQGTIYLEPMASRSATGMIGAGASALAALNALAAFRPSRTRNREYWTPWPIRPVSA